jgi:hypothetical protein
MASAASAFKTMAKPAEFINKGIVSLWQNLDPQYLNCFELILMPDPAAFIANPFGAAMSMASIAAITKIYIKSIEIGGFSTIDYVREGIETHPSQVNYADEITITFYESDMGVVRRFLIGWRDSTMFFHPSFGWTFNDNQAAARKNAVILPVSGVGLPSFSVIQVRGLKFKSMGDVTFEQDSSEVLTISATFACNRVDWF